MLYVILVLAFFGFRYFNWNLLAAARGACAAALAGFILFVAQPVYRMQVLHEKPGQAIANSKFFPMAAQFIPYLNLSNAIFGAPGAGTYAGPCVHYSHYQQKLMNLYGVQSTAITGYGHSALRFVEDGRVYMTDNGFWYRKFVEIGQGNWSPEGAETLYVVEGRPIPFTPYLFPIAMILAILLSWMAEMALFSDRSIRAPFRAKGMIKILPQMTECPYKKSGGKVMIGREAEVLVLEPSEVRPLEDAPDLFFHKDIGHFQFVR